MAKQKRKKTNKIRQSILSAFFYSPEELEEASLELIDDGDAEFPADELPPETGDDSFLPGGSVREEEGGAPDLQLFDDDLDFSEEKDQEDAARLVWDNGDKVVPDDFGALSSETAKSSSGSEPIPPGGSAGGPPPELPEEINLFDEESGENVRKSSGRTRIFRPSGKSTAAVRVNVNETKTSRAVERAQRQNEERERKIREEREAKRAAFKKRVADYIKRSVLSYLFGGFIAAAVLFALYYTFLLSDVAVFGNDQYSADYIIEQSGLEIGKHMLLIDLDDAKTRIEENPYLQVNDITYIFPSHVRINLTERKEAAGILGLDYNVIIDENGYVLSMSGGTDLSDLLQITGISMSGFQLGQRVGNTSDFATSTMITLIEKLTEYELKDAVSTLDMTTPLSIAMYTRSGLKIFIGQPTDLDAKFTALQSILPRLSASGITSGTLYLSAKGGTVYSPPNATATNTISGSFPDAGQTGTDTGEPSAEAGGAASSAPAAPSETPAPATPSPVPIQPGGGDDFQG